MYIQNLVIQKLHQNLPSIAGDLMAIEYQSVPNIKEALNRINTIGTNDSVMHSFSFKPNKKNPKKLNLLSIGTCSTVLKSVLNGSNDIVICVPSITYTSHSSETLETISLGTNSLIPELKDNHVKIEIVPSGQSTKELEMSVVREVLYDYKFNSLLKGWKVNVLLAHSEAFCLEGSNLFNILNIGFVTHCDEQRTFIEELSGLKLHTTDEEEILRSVIRVSSPTNSISNTVITKGTSKRIAYVGNRSTPSTIKPVFIDIDFNCKTTSDWFNQFTSKHFDEIVTNESLVNETNLGISLNGIEELIMQKQKEAECNWLNCLD